MLDTIKTRRSVRRFMDKSIPHELIQRILEAGRWAPSGLNNQPWRVALITDTNLQDEISRLTQYSGIVLSAKVLIAVFLHNAESYDRTKDVQAIGAFIQNMLLETHSLGLGAVWLGEIIKSNTQIKKILGVDKDLELMAVVALGYPDEKPRRSSRKKIEDIIIFRQ